MRKSYKRELTSFLSECCCGMGFRNRFEISVSNANEDIIHIASKLQRDNLNFSDEICRLIRDGYSLRENSSLPRMDMFFKYKIRGKTVAEALYDGLLSEEEITNCFLSCKNFIEEMYSSPVIQHIVDRHLNGDINLNAKAKKGLDKWIQRM